MNNKQIEIIKNIFSYHPPKSQEESAKHDVVNNASLVFALSLSEVIHSPGELITVLRKIQEVRMLANASVCYDRVGVCYQDIFKN